MVRHGFKNKEIADELQISIRGVGAYMQETLRMLGLQGRKELVLLWRNGER
jgi:DNA-binding NarL/FixJ family response regulator